MTQDGLRHPVAVRVVHDDQRRAVDAPKTSVSGNSTSQKIRVYLCIALFGAVFCGLGVRLAQVSFGMASDVVVLAAKAENPARALVYDRRGQPLILNREAEGLAIHGRDVFDIDEAVYKLIDLFPHVDAGYLRKRLENRQYALVVDSITPEQKRLAIASGLPGLSYPETTERAYPQKDLAAHVIGYTIPGRGGATGVEHALDRETFTPTGGEVHLTLDLLAQQILEDELAAAMQTFKAKAAWGVLLDADTGGIVALASLPDYNPNLPSAASDEARRNRTMSDYYELGSAFKPITVAMALENESVDLNEVFEVRQPIDVGGWQIRDYSVKAKPLSVSEIIQHSSNIGTVKIVQRLGKKSFVEGMGRLGLLSAIKTQLPERRTPSYPKTWRPSELATASYGHGIAVTPLQLTAAFAAVVNGGVYHAPTFSAQSDPAQERIFSEVTSAKMRIMLRKAVTDGTGGKADAAGYYVIGKTATADKPTGGRYRDDGELVSSFIGAFPGYDPKYVLLVSLDEPEGTKKTYGYATAGHVAAPIFRRVVERVSPPLGIMPVGDDVAFDGFVGMRRETAEVRINDRRPAAAVQGAN